MTKICADCKYYEHDNINNSNLCIRKAEIKVDEITGEKYRQGAKYCKNEIIKFKEKKQWFTKKRYFVTADSYDSQGVRIASSGRLSPEQAANFCSSARIFFEAKINAPEPKLSLFLENNLQLTKDESDSLAQKILEFLHL